MIICTPLSQLLPVKNVAGVFKAVKELDEVTVYVVGGGDTADLEKLARLLKIEKRVKYFGKLPNDRAMKVLEKSDVFVLNSFHEGLPHAMIEALRHEVPIIATKIPAFTEILKDKETALLVNIDDPKDLAEKIKLVAKYKAILVKNGKKLYQEKFTWEAHLTALYNVFDEVTAFASYRGTD